MKEKSTWQFDEMRPTGVDYRDALEVAAYDQMHRKFRDYAASAKRIVQALGLGPDSTVIDMGSGTGAFTLHAAGSCRIVHAVDPSEAMLAYCRQQAESAGLTNVVFHHGGLLTYEHEDEPADAIVCVAVLHHLPDCWKQVALGRCHAMLKPGGRLYLFDIVFPSDDGELLDKIGPWLEAVRSMADEQLADEAVVHVRDEFSTYDWIVEGMLSRSGFQIDTARYDAGFQATYVCTRR